VHTLAKHKPYFTWTLTKPMLDFDVRHGQSQDKAPNAARLTARKREIVQLLAGGHNNTAISAVLGIGGKTVETVSRLRHEEARYQLDRRARALRHRNSVIQA